MSVPRTYLLTAPSDVLDPFGNGKSSSYIIGKLKKINPRIWVEADHEGDLLGVWRPGKERNITCLWFGIPGIKDPYSRKITGFTQGWIPEYTQVDQAGEIITLGWRRILEKCIRSRAVRQVDVEKAFGVTLDIAEAAEDGNCPSCRKTGREVKSEGAKNFCSFHGQLDKQVEQARELKSEIAYLRRKAGCPATPSLV